MHNFNRSVTLLRRYNGTCVLYHLSFVRTIDAHDPRMPVIVFRRLDLSSYLALSIYMPTDDRYLDSLTSGVASMEQLLPPERQRSPLQFALIR